MAFHLFLASLVFVFLTFVLEMLFPMYPQVILGYTIVILYVLQYPNRIQLPVILICLTSAIVIMSYIFQTFTVAYDLYSLINHIVLLFGLWLAFYFSRQYRKLHDVERSKLNLLKAVFNNTKEGMLIFDAAGKICLANTFAIGLFGYTVEEFIHLDVDSLIPDRFRLEHQYNIKTFVANRQTRFMGKNGELFGLRKDGQEFPIEIRLSYFTNQSETFAIAFMSDLTEKKKIFDTLNFEEKLARTYFELAPVLFLALDGTGKIIGINDFGCKLLGYSKMEIVGKNWFTSFLSNDIQDEVIEYFKKILDGPSVIISHENAVLNKQGDAIEINWKNTVVNDFYGIPTMVVTAGIDISEKKKNEKVIKSHHDAIVKLNNDLELKIRMRTAELEETIHKLEESNRELLKSQQIFREMAHNFPNGVIGVLDKEMRYVFADGAELQNIGLHENGVSNHNNGERVFNNIHPALSGEAEEKLRKVFLGQKVTYDIELGENTYSISSVPIPDKDNQINEILIVIRNVTRRKKVEESLLKSIEKEKELTKMKSHFVSMASHEFRTPLSTILSSVFLLENYTGVELENSKAIHLGKIKRSVNNLTELLNDFLLLGKLEEGRIKVEYEEIDIEKFLEELVPEMELLRKGDQTIRCEYSGEEHILTVDKKLLRSIFLNLVSNAIKYSSLHSEIKLEAFLNENELVVNVIDNGIGIPLNEQRHIFKRFYRAHNAINIEGTGLGLNIIRKYVKLMKGRIEFKSRLNEGTTFTVRLPLIPSHHIILNRNLLKQNL